jgi:hypothetical protein
MNCFTNCSKKSLRGQAPDFILRAVNKDAVAAMMFSTFVDDAVNYRGLANLSNAETCPYLAGL